MGAVQPAPGFHGPSTYTYDAMSYVDDASALVSLPSTVTAGMSDWPAGTVVASWESPATSRFGIAANTSNAVERTVVMGRNMPGRVIPYVDKNGYGHYGGTPKIIPRGLERVTPNTIKKVDLWFNKSWLDSEMSSGSRLIDIGEPPGLPPSEFYNMELNQVDGYGNYFQDIQP